MWFMKKRGEGRLQKESQEAEPEAPFGFTSLLLLAVSLFAVAYIVAFGFHPGEWRAYVKDLLFAIGTALLVTWGFTRLVEIPHVAKYMARKLAEVMFGERYLRSIRSSLPDLRGRID